jgi:hypothetical protein
VCWICPESLEQHSFWSENCLLSTDAPARASKWQTCLYWSIECSFLFWQCAAFNSKANTTNVNICAKYHWHEAEISLQARLIVLTRIWTILMRQGVADLLINKKFNFSGLLGAPCSNCRPLCYYTVYFIVFLCKRPPEPNWITMKKEAACPAETSEQTHCITWYKNPQTRHLISVHSKGYLRIFLTTFHIYISRLSRLWYFYLIQLGNSRSSGQHSA